MKSEWSKIIKQLTLLTQLGLSLIMPLLMCLAFCWFLTYKFGVGVWVYILGKDDRKKVSFNRHK